MKSDRARAVLLRSSLCFLTIELTGEWRKQLKMVGRDHVAIAVTCPQHEPSRDLGLTVAISAGYKLGLG